MGSAFCVCLQIPQPSLETSGIERSERNVTDLPFSPSCSRANPSLFGAELRLAEG